jgi:hypothetical protein
MLVTGARNDKYGRVQTTNPVDRSQIISGYAEARLEQRLEEGRKDRPE